MDSRVKDARTGAAVAAVEFANARSRAWAKELDVEEAETRMVWLRKSNKTKKDLLSVIASGPRGRSRGQQIPHPMVRAKQDLSAAKTEREEAWAQVNEAWARVLEARKSLREVEEMVKAEEAAKTRAAEEARALEYSRKQELILEFRRAKKARRQQETQEVRMNLLESGKKVTPSAPRRAIGTRILTANVAAQVAMAQVLEEIEPQDLARVIEARPDLATRQVTMQLVEELQAAAEEILGQQEE